MGYIEQTKILEEYSNFLRNSDILSTTVRGVTTTSDTDNTTLTGSETITLSNSGVKNIRSVVYDGSILTYLDEFTFDIEAGTITLLDVVPDKEYTITYDYGTGDKIYSDYPRLDLTISSYPRIGFGVYGFNTVVAGFGNVLKSAWRFDIRVYGITKKQTDELIDAIRQANIDSYVGLKYTNRLIPGNVFDLDIYQPEKGRHKIYVKGIDINVINEYEVN